MRSAWFLPPLAAWFLAASAAPSPAQEEKAKPTDPAMEEFTSLQKEYRLKIRDAGVKENADEARVQAAKDFLPKFRTFADGHVGTEAGLAAARQILGAWTRVIRPGGEDASFDAELQGYLEKHFAQAAQTAKEPEVKAAAHAALGDLLWEDGEATGDRLARARAAYESAVKILPDAEATQRARGNLFEIQHLQVGKPAPDFEFLDLAGKTRKLSEFRGKVLLLNYWATW